MALFPKIGLDTTTCEIARLLKVTQSAIEPIHFTVPRKSDIFQDDLYPTTFAYEPSLTANEWASGKDAEPKTVQLGPSFVPAQSKQSTDFKPSTKSESAPRSAQELERIVDEQNRKIAALEAEIKRLKA